MRVALLHGPNGFVERLTGILAGAGYELEHAEGRDQLLAGLQAGLATVAVVDHQCLAGLPAGVVRRAAAGGSARVPVVVLGCPDTQAVSAALASGAILAARRDASPDEMQSLVVCAAAGEELQRSCVEARADLERHQVLALKDDLTAAHNRRFFERYLQDEIDRARRTGGSVGLIFMDLDNLRQVNRAHGHPMGSNVLREAAARTIALIRSCDKAVRYGGDEFCIVLPGTDWRGALEVAERVRQGIAGAPFPIEGDEGVTLTASFGIASFPEHATTRAGLVKAADEAMGRIKESQKNGILVAGGPAS
jgi:diguanylate cyclase (GGDEF)-like protein